MVKERQAVKINESKLSSVRQFKVRTNLAAGESVEACLKNLDYWKKEYDKRCLLT